MYFRVTLVLAGMSAVFVGLMQQPAPMETVLLRDVRLIDGTEHRRESMFRCCCEMGGLKRSARR
jgi:hypothetical protein